MSEEMPKEMSEEIVPEEPLRGGHPEVAPEVASPEIVEVAPDIEEVPKKRGRPKGAPKAKPPPKPRGRPKAQPTPVAEPAPEPMDMAALSRALAVHLASEKQAAREGRIRSWGGFFT